LPEKPGTSCQRYFRAFSGKKHQGYPDCKNRNRDLCLFRERVIMPQFTLKINLGNEAMQTGYDIAYAVRDVAFRLQDYGNIENIRTCKGTISDINGNTVGSWQVK
jgi:hypothetical protein